MHGFEVHFPSIQRKPVTHSALVVTEAASDSSPINQLYEILTTAVPLLVLLLLHGSIRQLNC
jgi:hypothetical protein